MSTINGLECELLACSNCAYVGGSSYLYRVKCLSNDMVLCEDCIKNKTHEELGIEPMDKEK